MCTHRHAPICIVVTEAIKADPDAADPVSSSSTDTSAKGDKATKSGRGKSGGKVKVEPAEDKAVEKKAAKSGARERPAGITKNHRMKWKLLKLRKIFIPRHSKWFPGILKSACLSVCLSLYSSIY